MAHAAFLVEHNGEGVATRCPAEREDASDDGDTEDGETARQDEYDPSSRPFSRHGCGSRKRVRGSGQRYHDRNRAPGIAAPRTVRSGLDADLIAPPRGESCVVLIPNAIGFSVVVPDCLGQRRPESPGSALSSSIPPRSLSSEDCVE